MNLLLIPDGLRRYARKNQLSNEENYVEGGRKLFNDAEYLFQKFNIIGVFPLALYNLERSSEELSALLQGGLVGLNEYVTKKSREIVIIGETEKILQYCPDYASVLTRCKVNPHLNGCLHIPNGSLVIFLCYDGVRYLHQLFQLFSLDDVTRHLLNWNIVYRTGCERNVIRLSSTFLGIEQAMLVGSRYLYQEQEPQMILDDLHFMMT